MGIHVIGRPGPYGGVISGRLDRRDDGVATKIVIYQKIDGNWTLRNEHVTAARLWSCDLGHDFAHAVESWQVQLVNAGFHPPGDHLTAGGQVIDTTTVAPSALTIEHEPDSVSHVLAGRLSPSVKGHDPGLFAYAWVHDPIDPLDGSGWVLVDERVKREPGGLWKVQAGGGRQYAVVLVEKGIADEEMVTGDLGIIPAGKVGDIAFDEAIKILVPPGQDGSLTGAVTGLGCVCDQTCIPPHREEEQLWIAAWITDTKGVTTYRERVACLPSGHWSFPTLTTLTRGVALTLALTTYTFKPGDGEPQPGDEVIAVTRFEGERFRQS
jgi:hypothetical protein